MKELAVILRACGKEVETITNPLRPSWFSKLKCAASLIKPEYGGYLNSETDLYCIWDGDENTLSDYIKSFKDIVFIKVNYKSNQQSLNFAFELIESNCVSAYYKYYAIAEDDHLYWPGAYNVLLEGLNNFSPHFITTKDHAHRYLLGNQDLIGTDGIWTTKSAHWRTSESSVFSFAFRPDTFANFKNDLRFYNDSGENAVRDRDFFRSIIPKKYRLFNPVPGFSTHCIKLDLSPVRNWYHYNSNIEVL